MCQEREEAVVEPSRGSLGSLWGAHWAVLELSWVRLGAISILGRLDSPGGFLQAILGPSWAI